MANERGKSIDNTHLSIDQANARGFLHRDYIAHCHRWSHVIKYLGLKQRYKTARVLDIGCGKDVPMGRTLYSSKMSPEWYVGIEYNKANTIIGQDILANKAKFNGDVMGSVNFPTDFSSVDGMFRIDGKTMYDQLTGDKGEKPEDAYWQSNKWPNIITSFEVLEHVEPGHAVDMLKAMHEILSISEGVAFISTPNWDPHVGAAGNHVNEMKYEALGAVIEAIGFKVEATYGTFASIRDYKDQLEADGHLPLFNKLREYYDTNILATIFAPLYPQHSRNALWKLSVPDKEEDQDKKFGNLEEVEGPWTSSDQWEDLRSALK